MRQPNWGHIFGHSDQRLELRMDGAQWSDDHCGKRGSEQQSDHGDIWHHQRQRDRAGDQRGRVPWDDQELGGHGQCVDLCADSGKCDRVLRRDRSHRDGDSGGRTERGLVYGSQWRQCDHGAITNGSVLRFISQPSIVEKVGSRKTEAFTSH